MAGAIQAAMAKGTPVDRMAAMGLQQTVGNRAVRRLLAGEPREEGSAASLARNTTGEDYDSTSGGDDGAPKTASEYYGEMQEDTTGGEVKPPMTASQFFDPRIQAAEDERFRQSFATVARVNVINMLLGSELMVHSERKRYGIPLEALDPDTMAAPEPASQVAEGGENEGLAAAAQELAKSIGALSALYRVLENRATAAAASGGYDPLGQSGRAEDEASQRIPYAQLDAAEVPEGSEELIAEIEMAKQDYELRRAELVQAYPILAMYAPPLLELEDSNSESLGIVAKGTPEAKAILAVDIAEKLENIKTTRDAIASGELDVWTLTRVVEMTKRQFKVDPGSHEDMLIEEAAADAEWNDIMGAIALTALGIGFGLAAFVTGGGTAPLAAQAFAGLALGISAIMTAEEFQDYIIESAAAGTDFDKAQAVLAQEPSPIWLALAVVGLVIDVADAVRIVGALRPAAERALAALARQRLSAAPSAVDEATVALDDLRMAGNTEAGGLGDEIVEAAYKADERAAARPASEAPEGGPTLEEIRKGEPSIEPGYGPPDITGRVYVNNNPRASAIEIRVGTQLDECAERGELPGIIRVEGRAEIPGRRSADYDFVTEDERRIPVDLLEVKTDNTRSLTTNVMAKSGQANAVILQVGAGKSNDITMEAWKQLIDDVFATPDHDIRRIIVFKDGNILFHEVAR